MQRTLTSDEEIRAELLLVDASATVRAYARQDFTAVEDDTVRVRIKDGKLRLPQRPVTAITAVTNTDGDDIVFTWYSGDVVNVSNTGLDWFEREPLTTSPTYVDVTYDHGYETIPDEVIKIVCRIAATALGSPSEEAGVQSESIAGYSYTRGVVAAAGGLFDEEKRELDAYRAVGGSARLAT